VTARPRTTLVLLGLAVVVAPTSSCKEDEADHVRVLVRSEEDGLARASLSLEVDVAGGARATSFRYASTPDPAPSRGEGGAFDVSDFTLSFDAAQAGAVPWVEVGVRTRPGGELVDWGGDAVITLPGSGRTVPLLVTRGETFLQNVFVLDGDLQVATSYAGQIALGWPSSVMAGGVQVLAIDPERPQSLERPDDPFGKGARKIRVASRPSAEGSSDLFATSWIGEGSVPMVRVQSRTSKPADLVPQRVGQSFTAADLQVGCARGELRPPIVSALLGDGRVVVHAHDARGATASGAFASESLRRVNRIVGLGVTANDTATVVVNGDTSKLVQLDLRSGATLHEVALDGTAVSASESADGSRLLVASVIGAETSQPRLQIQSLTLDPPARAGDPVVIGETALVPGVPASRVSLASCAVAWPVVRSDGSKLIDVRYRLIDAEGRPSGDAHLANVGRADHHFSPSVVCLGPRAYVTFLGAASPAGPSGRLQIRSLPGPR